MQKCLQQVRFRPTPGLTKNPDYLYATAEALEFNNIDTFEPASGAERGHSSEARSIYIRPDKNWTPQRLSNGKWACNHKCKDKTVYVCFTAQDIDANCLGANIYAVERALKKPLRPLKYFLVQWITTKVWKRDLPKQ